MYKIYNLDGELIFEVEELKGANLYGADLSKANLSGVKGLIHIQWGGYSLYIQAEKTKIGCKYRSNAEWLAMPIKEAIQLGIEAKNYDIYRMFIKDGMKALK